MAEKCFKGYLEDVEGTQSDEFAGDFKRWPRMCEFADRCQWHAVVTKDSEGNVYFDRTTVGGECLLDQQRADAAQALGSMLRSGPLSPGEAARD